MSKHPVQDTNPKKEKTVWQINVYSGYDKTHILMTLEKSVRDVIKNWDACDYAISKEQYELDKNTIDQTMKRCGYVPVLSDGNKFKTNNGMYNFTYQI